MIGGMKLHLIDPVAETVEALQHRQVSIRLPPEIDHLGGPDLRAEARERRPRRCAPFALNRLPQRMIGGVEVVILQRRRLIDAFMRGTRARAGPEKYPLL